MASCASGDPAKRGVQSLGVPGGEPRSVSLIGGPEFECVSVTVWPCPILMESGGPAAAPRRRHPVEVRRSACAPDRPCIFLTSDFFHKPVVLNICLNSSCSFYL